MRDDDTGADLMPGWFTDRMMDDSWNFGILTSGNQLIMIEFIHRIWQAEDGQIWLDVQMLKGHSVRGFDDFTVVQAPTNRRRASINTAHVVAAFELAGSQ